MPKVGMEPLRRTEAINAALECFCICGIDKTTLDMVAEKAGFSKGVVAYYFKSKRKLMLDCMKSFLKSYQRKISSVIMQDMTPEEMLKKVVEVSLPPINDEHDEPINVSELDPPEKIRLPQRKIAKLFSQYVAKAALDDELKEIMKEVYRNDVAGIAQIIRFGKKVYHVQDLDEEMSAYTLLALIYGMSYFRITGFLPSGMEDNRAAAFQFIEDLFK